MITGLQHAFLAGLILPTLSFASPHPSYLEAPAVPAYDADSTGFTVEFWVRVRSKPGFNPFMIYLVNSDPERPCDYVSAADIKIAICNLSDCQPGLASIDLHGSGECPKVFSSVRIDDGRYHHLACAYQGSELRIFVDGALQGETIVRPKRLSFSGGRVVVGALGGYNQLFDGEIDELRIWSVARSVEQIRDFMNAEIDPCPAELVGYWRFNGNGDDRAHSANDLVPHNNVIFRPGKLGLAAHLLNHDSLRGSIEGLESLVPPIRREILDAGRLATTGLEE